MWFSWFLRVSVTFNFAVEQAPTSTHANTLAALLSACREYLWQRLLSMHIAFAFAHRELWDALGIRKWQVTLYPDRHTLCLHVESSCKRQRN